MQNVWWRIFFSSAIQVLSAPCSDVLYSDFLSPTVFEVLAYWQKSKLPHGLTFYFPVLSLIFLFVLHTLKISQTVYCYLLLSRALEFVKKHIKKKKKTEVYDFCSFVE